MPTQDTESETPNAGHKQGQLAVGWVTPEPMRDTEASLVAQLVKNACNAGDLGSIPGWERSPKGGAWLPTPVLLPGESHDRGDWWATVNGVTKRLSN